MNSIVIIGLGLMGGSVAKALKNKNHEIVISAFDHNDSALDLALDVGIIDKKISMERLEKVQNLLFKNQIRKNKLLENRYLNVLVENFAENKTQVFGRTEHMTSVIFDGNKSDIGKIVQVKIKQSNRTTLQAEKINSSNQKVA